jgi:hypothetical protein
MEARNRDVQSRDGEVRAGIKKHYGTGAAIVTRANVNSPKIKKYLYRP